MADGASSPLFMPQGTPEGKTSPSKHSDGSGSGNGNGSGMGSINSEQGRREPKSNLQTGANMEQEVKDEQPPSPPRQLDAFFARGGPTASPRPFAPLTSRAERQRRKAARESAAPRVPHSPPPPPQNVDMEDLLGKAHRHLNALAADLRKEEKDACDREEHLATLLEHAREIRSRAIQDRSNGLVIIRDRKKKLEELEKRLFNDEEIDPAELIGVVDPLKLKEPVEREEFERMKVEGRGEEHEDGYETDPHGSG